MMDRKRGAIDADGVVPPPAKRHNSSVVSVRDGGAVGGNSSANKEVNFGAIENPFRYDLDVRIPCISYGFLDGNDANVME
jgi:hypothetical protein